MHSLALVVVTHNSASWLGPFVETWKITAEKASLTGIPLMVADAGSRDDSLATVEKLFPDAKILRLANIGYGAAANAGIRETTAEWVLLCNPDLTFPPTFAADLLSHLDAAASPWPDNVAIIGPRLVNPDGAHQFSVGRFPGFMRLLHGHFRPRDQRSYVVPPPQQAGAVEWLTGACLLIRRKYFEAVGGFDPGFFMYQDEVDLMRRLADAGYATWYNPGATVIHHAPTALLPPSDERMRWSTRATQHYLAKHASFFTYYLSSLYWFLRRRIPAGDLFTRRGTLLARGTVHPDVSSGVPPCPHP
jgi:N-acetylglucosaminyl-diphospho-decaprenol L-rhamnosyltransferase